MSTSIRRGDIYIIDFDPPKGEEYKVGSEIMKRRPAVVISRDAINNVRRTVMVVPLSIHVPKPVENQWEECLHVPPPLALLLK